MSKLPGQFADLEPFSEWCLREEAERFEKRIGSSMKDLQAFYDAATPRAREAMDYCDQFPLDAMPADALNLLHLLYSLVTISFAVECWSQPRVPDIGSTYLDLVATPGP